MKKISACFLCLLAPALCFFTETHSAFATGNTEKSVQETVSSVVSHHNRIKSIQENREAIRHELDRAKAGYGPSLDARAAGGLSAVSTANSRRIGEEDTWYEGQEWGVTLTQPVWDGFATRSRVRTTQATLDSMNNRLFDNATTLGLDGIIAHLNVLRTRRIVELAKENVMRHEEILVYNRARADAGADTGANVSQTEARLARAKSTLSASIAAQNNAEKQYVRLTGTPARALASVAHPETVLKNAEEVTAQALQSNPKVRAYQDDVRAAQGKKELSQSAYHPVINLEAGAYSSDRNGSGDEYTSRMEVMATVKWNLFNSGADRAAVAADEARIRQAKQNLYSLWDDIQLEVAQTWTDYSTAKEQYSLYMDAKQYNTQTRDAYTEQFLLGQRSLLDVLDAENELFNSSTQVETMASNVLVAEYRLEALTGLLLPHLGVNTESLAEEPKENAPHVFVKKNEIK